jgi:hypothetical protein
MTKNDSILRIHAFVTAWMTENRLEITEASERMDIMRVHYKSPIN